MKNTIFYMKANVTTNKFEIRFEKNESVHVIEMDDLSGDYCGLRGANLSTEQVDELIRFLEK